MSAPEVQFIPFHSRRPTLIERLHRYKRLTRLDRPIGIFLLMWPALWALWLAGDGHPPWTIVLVFIFGVVLMRSAGCAINDFADRRFDGRVERTRQRPLATGEVRPKEAIVVFLGLSSLALLMELLTLNGKTVALSVVALLLTTVYPFMKRITHIPQLGLGAAFGWAVPMAFTAITGTLPVFAWAVFTAALIWALIYDTQYAMVDRDDDLKIGIKSSAILFGQYDRLIIGLLQILMLALLAAIGAAAGRGAIFFSGLMLAAGLSVYQQYLTRSRERNACFTAFLNNHYYGMVVFVALALDYAVR